MNELELIRHLTQSLPRNDAVVTGAGDDCAVLDLGAPGRFVLFKTDAVVEGIHFTREAAPEKVGHKALARCLSDVAAMAGTPVAAVVTVGLPRDFDSAFVTAIYDGLNSLARRHAVAIVGGETTTNPERIFISVAILGTVAKEKCIHRSGAKVGDAIFVSGELGGSLAGRHLDFEPRLAEGRWLAENFPIHSMIDLSDGLASDLRHLLESAGVGAELLLSAIPISCVAKLQARGMRADDQRPSSPPPSPPSEGGEGVRSSVTKPPLLAALTDGEDFELLFTVAARDAVPLADAWRKQFPEVKLSCIGKITAERGLRIRDKDRVMPFTGHGYVHFT